LGPGAWILSDDRWESDVGAGNILYHIFKPFAPESETSNEPWEGRHRRSEDVNWGICTVVIKAPDTL